ncbi:BTB/POZ and MATH domain-containing protein 2-like [Aegilops tauschii subsp. strangulata]|uniref:Speckle-type POZ protein-like protein n=1 Tax=Aegilops tauschii TaxID=37682 RepID=M8BE87_AEGTA|nr:BTB/POZ and MATH domain-containing protein 2-like [Aegilops tauschii subsp. strangulata]
MGSTNTPATRHAANTVGVQQGQGSHVFEIAGYSLHRSLLHGGCAMSAAFSVGGYDWQFRVYPWGVCDLDYYRDYVGVFLDLCSDHKDARVRASFRFSLVDVTGSSPPHTMTKTREFGSGGTSCSGDWVFKKRSELEGSPYLRDDRLTVECVVTIVEDENSFVEEVPPSDITDHLGKLLQGKEGTDVIFEVQGEAFPAHKLVLAMRSPVFKAELYGAMREKDMSRITINDMQPAVFEALLHFIYTDSLPAMDDIGRDDYKDIVSHLLVAADRYAMERLKLICESILYKNIDVKTVVSMLAFADWHHCSRLNDACIRFIATLDTRGMDDMMTSQGYVKLKETCPLALVELLEKTSRLAKSKSSIHIGSLVYA